MDFTLQELIQYAGFGQLFILIASSLVPVQLNWKTEFVNLSKLNRQLFWVYGGYIVLSIVSLGLVCIFNSHELASGSQLARFVCGYITIFWGIRLSLQLILDVKQHLTKWWLTIGYHLLTLMFISLTSLFAYATFA